MILHVGLSIWSFVLLSKFALPDNVPFLGEVLFIKPILQHLLCAIGIPCLQQTTWCDNHDRAKIAIIYPKVSMCL